MLMALSDSYVHRLIQNKSDGKLVELPSATLSTRMTSLSLASAGPTASDEKWVTSLERATGEAQRLAAQLAEREEAFEREMERVREERERTRLEKEHERAKMDQLRREMRQGEDKLRELEQARAELERGKTTAEKKAQIVSLVPATHGYR
jgi:BRCA1-associated protein